MEVVALPPPEKKRKLNAEEGGEISAYFILQFQYHRCTPCAGAIYQFKMGIEQGRPVLRAEDVEKLDPMVVLGQGISNGYLQGCVLGSYDLHILLREHNNSCRVSLCPVLASFTLSTKTNETLKFDLRC